MKLDVMYLSVNPDVPPHSFWDHGFISQYLFAQFDCNYYEVDSIPEKVKGGVVVLPARNQKDYIEEINRELAKLDYLVLLLTGDEESEMQWRELKHPRMLVWVMSPKQGMHDDAAGKLGSGYREEEPELLREIGLQDRTLNFFFAGQVTHPIREQCVEQLKKVPNGRLVETKGFGQGIEYREYLENMARAKFVPCPSGPETADTFRLFEALEAGCVPIGDGGNYWPFLFGEEVPFPIVSDWSVLPSLMPELLRGWPQSSNRVYGWWQLYKRRLADKLEDQIITLSGERPRRLKDDQVVCLIPAAPIPTNPSSEVIDETIESIRERLPDSEIIVMFDACPDQKAELKEPYEEFKRRFLWRIAHELDNVIPIVFSQHSHQSLMTKEALKLVRTDIVLFMEQDCPLYGETPIRDISKVIEAGYANSVRFQHEAQIIPEHQYLMLDKEPIDILGVPLIRTRQWSGRPSLISTKFFRYIAGKYFDDQPRFIEHICYGLVVHGDYDEFRLHLYAPPGGTFVRHIHTDGRRRGAKVYDPTPS